MRSPTALGRRDRRTLIVGGSTVVVLMLAARGLPALRDWEAARISDAATSSRALSDLRAGRASLRMMRDSLTARAARLAAVDSAIISAPSASMLASSLAARVSDLADDHAIKVTTMLLRFDSLAVAGLVRADVRLTGTTDVQGLADFLQAVEGAAAPMRVRELNISQPDPLGPANRAEALRIDLIVEALGTVARGEHQ
jgi:hypothetical protein